MEDLVLDLPMQIELIWIMFNQWGDAKVKQLFLPNTDEYPKDTFAWGIRILMDAQNEPER